jgi:hypothetical protein
LIYLVAIVVTFGVACIFVPVFGLLWVAIFLSLIIGWIAISVPFGTAILHRLKVYPSRMLSAAVGALVLTLVQGLLSMIPCVGALGWLMLILFGSVGFGAVLLTRFGTHPYPEIIAARVSPKIL